MSEQRSHSHPLILPIGLFNSSDDRTKEPREDDKGRRVSIDEEQVFPPVIEHDAEINVATDADPLDEKTQEDQMAGPPPLKAGVASSLRPSNGSSVPAAESQNREGSAVDGDLEGKPEKVHRPEILPPTPSEPIFAGKKQPILSASVITSTYDHFCTV